jgi:hypothetical protein
MVGKPCIFGVATQTSKRRIFINHSLGSYREVPIALRNPTTLAILLVPATLVSEVLTVPAWSQLG